jgi:hypothetical protein
LNGHDFNLGELGAWAMADGEKRNWFTIAWAAFWYWIDWHGKITTVIVITISVGGAAVVNRIAAIWGEVHGIYLYIVTLLGFALFLATIVRFAGKLEPSSESRRLKVSDTKESATESRERDPRLTINAYRYPRLVLEPNSETWREGTSNDKFTSKGLVFLVQNDPHDDGTCIPAEGLRAQLIWTYNNGSPGPSFSPAPWLCESLGIINLQAGTSGSLLVGTACQNYWTGWANPRTSQAALPGNRSEMVPHNGLLFVRLSGPKRIWFEAYLKWEIDYSYNHPFFRQIPSDDAKAIISRGMSA